MLESQQPTVTKAAYRQRDRTELETNEWSCAYLMFRLYRCKSDEWRARDKVVRRAGGARSHGPHSKQLE